MKNLIYLLIPMFMLFACNNSGKKAEEKTETKEVKCEHAEKKESCCKEKELTEEQKAEIAAWNDWNNQTPEKKQELVASKKACMDKKMAECKEKCEAKVGEEKQCPEKEAKCAEIKAKWENWDNLTLEEQKALLDEMCSKLCKKDCCKSKEHKECEKDKK